MMDSRELTVLRKQTKHFIADNPAQIILSRPASRQSDGAGGYKPAGDPTPLDPQTMRKVTLDQRGEAINRTNVDGTVVQPDFVLIGEFDANIDEGDTFKIGELEYRVLYVRDDRRYETWAEVYRYG